jgi:WD40 repeat protein
MNDPNFKLPIKCVQTIVHSRRINSICLSKDNQIIVSTDGVEVKLWNLQTGELLRVLINYSGGLCNALTISPDNQIIAGACNEYSIGLWNLHTGEYLKTLEFSTWYLHPYTSVAFCADSTTLISGGSGQTHSWNIHTGKQSIGPTSLGSRLTISPNGHIIVGDLDRIQITEIPRQRPVKRIENLSDCVGAVAITPDGKICAVGIFDGTIKFWDWETYQELLTIQAHSDIVKSMAFTPDGQTLVSGSSDKTIKFWDVKTGELKAAITENLAKIYGIALSADGRYLVSSDNQKTIQVWQL